jgi:hypothetical protein
VTGQPPDLVPVFLTVGIRTSGGCGPGVVLLPPDEASWAVTNRHGVRGDQPPRGYADGGSVGPGWRPMTASPVRE